MPEACDVIMPEACDVIVPEACDVIMPEPCDVIIPYACDVIMAKACDVIVAKVSPIRDRQYLPQKTFPVCFSVLRFLVRVPHSAASASERGRTIPSIHLQEERLKKS